MTENLSSGVAELSRERILLLLKRNKQFKTPVGSDGKCIVTNLKTGCFSEFVKMRLFRDMWFSHDSDTKTI